MSEADKEAIKSLLYQVIQNIDTIGLPKHPFIINAPSSDGHSLFLVIWPAFSPDWRTKTIEIPKGEPIRNSVADWSWSGSPYRHAR